MGKLFDFFLQIKSSKILKLMSNKNILFSWCIIYNSKLAIAKETKVKKCFFTSQDPHQHCTLQGPKN